MAIPSITGIISNSLLNMYRPIFSLLSGSFGGCLQRTADPAKMKMAAAH
jgi:hypothetical protein